MRSGLVRTRAAIIAAMFAGASAAPVTGQSELDSWNAAAMHHAMTAIRPSMARIETVGGTATGGGGRPFTGTVVDDQGHLLTALFNLRHEPEAIIVSLADGRRVPARIVATDTSRQLIMLRIESDSALKPAVALPARDVRPGQTAIAVGMALDPGQPGMTAGIISATGRIEGRALQTDARVSPDNYGGPLVDLDGKVLGILVPLAPGSGDPGAGADWYDSGIGFAVPLDPRRLDSMRDGKSLRPGLHGMTFKEEAGFASAAKVSAVRKDSPASRADLAPGDVVRAVNGVEIRLLTELRQELGPLYAGDRVEISIERGGVRSERILELFENVGRAGGAD